MRESRYGEELSQATASSLFCEKSSPFLFLYHIIHPHKISIDRIGFLWYHISGVVLFNVLDVRLADFFSEILRTALFFNFLIDRNSLLCYNICVGGCCARGVHYSCNTLMALQAYFFAFISVFLLFVSKRIVNKAPISLTKPCRSATI